MNFTILKSDLPFVTKLVAKAAKKAEKLGVEPIVLVVKNDEARSEWSRGRERFFTVTNIEINGSAPKFAGWKLTGVISPLTTETGAVLPVVTTVPGETVSESRNAADPLYCDHCKARRDRLETFVVRHEDGTEKQVGRNCLTDFLGDRNQTPAAIAALMGSLAEVKAAAEESLFKKGTRTFDSESLVTVLAVTRSVTRNHPWVSGKEAYITGKTSTKARVMDALQALNYMPEDMSNEEAVAGWKHTYGRYLVDLDTDLPTTEDFDAARQDREELSVLLDQKESEGKMNDYLNTIRILSVAGTVNHKAMGMAVSILSLLSRERGQDLNPLKTMVVNALKTSQFVGEPKKRMVFKGLTFIENIPTAAGFSVATFVDPAGNLIKTFSHQCLTPGQVVDLKATVVRHDTYKDARQTIVNRPVVQ